MIFAHTLDKVLSGGKTQTRRIVKPGDEFFPEELGDAAAVMHKGFSAYRLVYEVGRTYAVQPGRGKPAVARIQITRLRCEDVRGISWEDTHAEGFKNKVMFFNTWLQMHDPSIYEVFRDYKFPYGKIESATELLESRPAERYRAWVIEFELVK